MKNVKLNKNGTISYEKDGVRYRTVNTIHELAKAVHKHVIIKAKKVNKDQLSDSSIVIIE
jgi:hypothetical protein